jgi:hypothetical protein
MLEHEARFIMLLHRVYAMVEILRSKSRIPWIMCICAFQCGAGYTKKISNIKVRANNLESKCRLSKSLVSLVNGVSCL